MSQRQLASAAGLNITTIVDLESGRTRRPQVATIGKLADALGVPFEVLLAMFDEPVEASA
jgi:transcriptional regulator with XRE-family HTH domain